MMSTLSTLTLSKIIIGIDPGTKRIGYGVILQKGKQYSFVEAGLIKPRQEKILDSAQEFVKLIKKFQPSLLCIEKVFFSKNIRSAMSVSEIKGALTLEAEAAGLEIIEIAPTEVKAAICGYGQADKASVRKMIYKIVSPPKDLFSKDAIDALAIAIAGEIKQRGQKLFTIDN